ncbi:MAG: outer membrane beta-barrel protein [Aestuariivirga sp.]|nr:outer membrane beta-barrel protein [Aestuariivirga sp.]
MTKSFRALILSGAALSLWGGSALAADAPVPVDPGHFYVGVFGGATWFSENGTDFTVDRFRNGVILEPVEQVQYGPDLSGNVSLDTDTGFLIGGVVGYAWGDTGLRTELELSYSQANLDGFDVDWDNDFLMYQSAMPDGDDLDLDGDVAVTYIFGNIWYDFGHVFDMGGITPYLGGGLGVGFVDIDIDGIDGIDFAASGSETGFAFQLGGGLMWNIADIVNLDLGYRYRGVALDDYDESLTSQNVLLGITFGL